VATVEAGGVRQAARRIHLSPSAVTRSIQALEDWFGVPLLHREGKRVYPTAYGKALAEDAQAVFSGVRGLGTKLRQMAGLDIGVLRVGFSPSMIHLAARRLLPPILKKHPGAQIEIRQGHADQLLDAMLGGRLDLAVAHERPFALHPGITTEPLSKERIGWWVSAAHPLAAEPRVTLDHLFRHPIISQLVPTPYQGWLDELHLRAARSTPPRPFHHALQLNDYHVLADLLLTTDAVAMMPDPCAESSSSPLVRLAVEPEPPSFTVALARLRTAPASPLALRFISLLRGLRD
jgi:DNA-binding transcriptional LysR family regulator